MKLMRIAINGFGRIGRIFFRQCFGREGLEIVAINDLSNIENLAYLLKYDSVYGRWDKDVSIGASDAQKLIIDDKEILVFSEKDPEKLPWKDLNINVVVEATGFFTDSEKASAHIRAGAKKVLITAPTKDDTLVFTPGFELKESAIVSNASCTTNAVNPILAIMLKTVGVKKAILNTIHAYTATQSIVDGISSVHGGFASGGKSDDFRKGRAGAQNIIPSTTGAAESTAKVIPEISGKFDGVSLRVPVISGSIADITFVSEKPTTAEEINNIFREAEKEPRWQGILKVVDEQIVSSDILGEPFGAIVDLTLTRVVDGDLVKVFSWYDNEWGYAAMLIKHLESIKI